MSFRAKQIRFWKILPSFLGILVKAIRAGWNSFFSALNTAHSFSPTRKTFGKKAASKLQARELYYSFALCLSSSIQLRVKTAFHSYILL